MQGDLDALDLAPGSFDQIIDCSTVEQEDMVLTIPVGRDAVHAPLQRIYGEERLVTPRRAG